MVRDDELARIESGAEVLEVFWCDRDRRTFGLLLKSGSTIWADVCPYSEVPGRHHEDLESVAMVKIEDGEHSYKAG